MNDYETPRYRSLEEFQRTDFPENLEWCAPLLDWFVLEGADPVGVQTSYHGDLVTATLRDIEYHMGWNTAGAGLESTALLVAGSPLSPEVLEETARAALPVPLPDELELEIMPLDGEGTFVWLVRRFDEAEVDDATVVEERLRTFTRIADGFAAEWSRD